jgi:hypothetical protein
VAQPKQNDGLMMECNDAGFIKPASAEAILTSKLFFLSGLDNNFKNKNQ